MRYNNYHKHTHYSNLRTIDVITKPINYIERAKELGHNTYFTTEHGWGGNVLEAYTLCKENDLKMIFGVEAYYVDNRLEKDRSNNHIILIALNREGFKDINRIISEANLSGYYYKPRIDKELILSLNPKNVIITTACIAGRLFKTEDYEEEFVIPLLNHFKDHFYLEVQSHKQQSEYNKQVLELKQKYKLPLIHANDSHYIYSKDSKYRDMFLKAKGIFYEDEGSFILDYPNYEEIAERYEKQGVLNKEQIQESLNNTLIFDKCEDLKFDKEIKIPKIHKDKDSNKLLKTIISNEWKKERSNICKDKWNEYKNAIKEEVDIVEKTNMEDYFILDYEIVKKAVNEYKAVLTRTGRGSAPSFYINKLLGFTNIDRVSAPITLYPTRFMSTTRILQTRSLPDIDLNWANIEPVIKASKDILGEDGVYFMIAYKPLQNSSAFRLWCKSKGFNINEYNEVAKNLDGYLEDEKWGEIIEESKIFRGVIESVAPSPCSFLLLDKAISEEIGLIKVGNQICCCLDGYNCDQYKYLKNDYLKVSVWSIIAKVYEMIGEPIDTIQQLENKVDDNVWNLYRLGLTATLNQADSNYATPLIKKYSPKSIAEISAWVASIRPGFASLMNNFLERKPYTTGVKELDDLLQDSYHYMMYQESIMKYLVWLGIAEDETYGIIKKIAKKKFKEKELEVLKEKLLKGWIKNVGIEEGFENTWQVVNDASKYSFNASHSLSVGIDSLYGAYLKANHPLEYYTVVLNMYEGDTEETSKIVDELDYFKINVLPPKFRYSTSEYMCDKEQNSIYKGLSSIKYISKQVADELFELRNEKYNDFIQVLSDLNDKTSINSRQLDILIKLNYFSEFGKSKRLLTITEIVNNLLSKKQIKKDKLEELNLTKDIVSKYAQKETEKLFKEIDMNSLVKEVIQGIKNQSISIKDQLQAEIEYLGYPKTIIPKASNNFFYVTELKIFKNKRSITYYPVLYSVKNGNIVQKKLKDFRLFAENPFKEGCIINIIQESKEPKRKMVNGHWTKSETEFNDIIEAWEVY
ncbi:PHP domain-containing protein [Clostridium botulinum D/C]|uniref:PHP domain-containing protein n=1 Tax=Clostridium botulinum TaxID=1491 RepID=UPI001E629852|nr:PHP domain-containing protein [Clostridium botulinum]MCD3321144.1 PHP domain-containing protein [Clostridium botulinum D/C]MCD3324584.1 PHP domain-containing protein [Clostridium botulinum D/C]MCD3326850.1 PHP domain-containing protein [Clostridium botulinum D/C]